MAQRRPCCSAPPDKSVVPHTEDELETVLAEIPFGLHDIDDARLVPPTGW